MKRIACMLAAVASLLTSHAYEHQPNTLEGMCANLEQVLPEPGQVKLVPAYGSAFWTDSIPAAMRQGYIAAAEEYLGTLWPSIDINLFSQFRKDGNRVNYEGFIFGKRNKLATLVMGEIAEGQGRFLPDIINGLFSMCEEEWWGIPAHYGPEIPMDESQPLDLFNAESASLVAWTYHMLYDQLHAFSPRLTQRIEAEVQRRVLDNALHNRDWWRGAGMNWNPWICSNWLACALLVEPDRDKQLQAVREIAKSIDGFIDQYPADGGCDEGASYWDRAAGAFIDCVALLERATGGAISMEGDEKAQAMADYLCKMNVDNRHFVNFADASPYVKVRPEAYVGAKAVGSAPLMSLTLDSARRGKYFDNPATAYQADNFAPLDRELMTLSLVPQMLAASAESVLPFSAWLPRIQVITARSVPNSAEDLYFGAKGGHNDESHNHNDVGTFVLFVDGQPAIIDAGRATYRKETFNSQRYTLWNTQSGYHNLPQINGVDQQQGRSFEASDVKTNITDKRVKFALDIAGAYPDDAKVKTWKRTYDFQRGKKLDITEDYELSEYVAPTAIVLMASAKPQIADGAITLQLPSSACVISYNPSQLTPAVEEVAIDDDQILVDTWGKIYRIKLNVNSHSLKNKIKYSISAK